MSTGAAGAGAAGAGAAFLDLARDDLAAARRLLPDLPRVAAYHLQQAVEKLAKAELAAAGMAPPRSHDIGFLAGLLPLDHPRRAALAGLSDLTALALDARYPGADGGVAPAPDAAWLGGRAEAVEALLPPPAGPPETG